MRRLTSWSRREACSALVGAVVIAATGRTAGAQPTVHTVAIRKFAFDPPELQIRAGDTVEWRNLDIVPHTATAVDGAWDSGEIEGNDRSRVSFEEPGHHNYFCAFHPHMKATISVAAS